MVAAAKGSTPSEKDAAEQAAALLALKPPPPTSQDFKEMRIDYETFLIFISEVATWARDEYIVSNLSGLHERTEKKVAEHDLVRRIFGAWDSEKRGTLSFQVSNKRGRAYLSKI